MEREQRTTPRQLRGGRRGSFWRLELVPGLLESRFFRQVILSLAILLLALLLQSLPRPWGDRVREATRFLVTRDYDFGLTSRQVSSLQVLKEDWGLRWPPWKQATPPNEGDAIPGGDAQGNAQSDAQRDAQREEILAGLSLPVEGPMVSGFGWRSESAGGEKLHEGVDLGAPAGYGIKAAWAGTAALVGNDPDGYGRYLIIDHGAGVSTVYAHAADIFVTQGELVTRDQVVASVGQSGNAASPQLHFELRVDGKAIDPAPKLNLSGPSGS